MPSLSRQRAALLVSTRERAKPGEAQALLARIAESDHGTDCIPWPYSLTSSGHAAYQGTSVARVLMGLDPGDARQALHLCGMSDCVNPRHIVIGTHRQNMDMLAQSGRASQRRTA